MKKILFINTETSPYVAESTLAMMGKNVPELAQSNGCEIRTFMPKWGNINERRGQLHEMQRLSGMNIIINGTDHPLIIKVASIPVSRVQVYFIDNEDYFTRKGIEYDENGTLYPDNGERAIFFARGVLETVKKTNWCPDIIHCHGWITALTPLYVKSAYKEEPSFRNSKVVISLYDDNFNGTLSENFAQKTLHRDMSIELLDGTAKPATYEELAKLAIRYCDGIIINGDNVSPALIEYAQSLGKPVMPKASDDEYATACNNFYETII